MKTTYIAIAGLFGALFLGGCSQEAQQKASEAGASAANAADKAGEAVATDANKAGAAVKAAGAEAVEETKEAVQGPDTTFKVRTALEQGNLNITDLNVDTDATTNTVTIKGAAPNAEAKKRAETIAKGIVGEKFKIVNELTGGN